MIAVIIGSNVIASEYTIKIPLDPSIQLIATPEIWTPSQTEYSEWLENGTAYNCSSWSSDASQYSTGVKFNKTAECKINQVRTVTNYEVSNKGNKRQVGDSVEEVQVVDIEKNEEDIGTRFTHILEIGDYLTYGAPYSGYFSSNYVGNAGPNIIVYRGASLSNPSYKGYAIDHIFEGKENGYISMRLLPENYNTGFTPKMTIDGVTCQLYGPQTYSAYNGSCNFNLKDKIGQTVKIDIQ